MKLLLAIMMMVAAAALLAPPAGAGVVQTLEARLEGDVTFADGRVEVAGQAVPWDAVLYLLPGDPGRTLGPPGAVHLFGGEVWRGDILRLSAGRLAVRLGRFGSHEIEVGRVSALEFAVGVPLPGSAPPRPATLYREKGEPLPGTLLWVDETRLAIDSPLGVLTLPRDGALRYVFAAGARPAADAASDTVALADGTVLRGLATPVADGVRLAHTVLGPLTLRAGLIRWVQRGRPGVVSLASAVPASVVSSGPLGGAASGPPLEAASALAGEGRPATYMAALCLRPKRVVRYSLPQAAGKTLELLGRLRPVDGARGDVRVRVSAGGKALLDRPLAAAGAPVPVRLVLPPAGELVIEVDFASRIGFPCGVIFEDPLVVSR